jgi:hypothetical protein
LESYVVAVNAGTIPVRTAASPSASAAASSGGTFETACSGRDAGDCETSGSIHIGIDKGSANPYDTYDSIWHAYLQWYAGDIKGCPDQYGCSGGGGGAVDVIAAYHGDASFNQVDDPGKYLNGHGSSCSRTTLDDWQCAAKGYYGGYVKVEPGT